MNNSLRSAKVQVNAIVCCLMIIGLFLSSHKALAQTELQNYNQIGLTFGSFISGNGHGSMYTPQICFNTKKSALYVGPCIQKRAMQFNGVRMAYSFVLNSKPKTAVEEDEEEIEAAYQYFGGSTPVKTSTIATESRVNFKLFVYAEYLKDNLLSNSMVKMETHVNRVEGVNWNTAKLSTIEGGIGGQIGLRLKKNVYLNAYITASFFYHTKYINNMHHEQYSPCITIGTNITIPKIIN
jgi:hypothetical protein